MDEIIDVRDGGSVFLRGVEYGLIKIKYITGESAIQEDEFYCISLNKKRIIEMLNERSR